MRFGHKVLIIDAQIKKSLKPHKVRMIQNSERKQG